MRVLLTGASGFLGHYLSLEFERRGLECVRGGRRDCHVSLELADPDSIERALEDVRPERVLHAAALTSVGACEADPDLAHAVNSLAVRTLAQSCGSRLLVVSTDQVFDGSGAPYARGDAPDPLNVYGRTKHQAEKFALAAGAQVVRVPLLFGRSFDGRRGASDMLRSAAGVVRLFTNEFRTPLHAADAALGLTDLVLEPSEGVVQLAGRERVSRHELGLRFARAVELDVAIEPASCTDPLRPRDVSLIADRDCGRDLDSALAES